MSPTLAPDTLRLMAEVLDYPTQATRSRCRALADRWHADRPDAAQELDAFLGLIGQRSVTALQELYAATFDVNPACCLYVGFHLFGETYKRGAFLAALNGEYHALGFSAARELPDHLGVMFRFLACTSDTRLAAALAHETMVPALRTIVRAFDGTDNPYAALLRAMLLAWADGDDIEPVPAARVLPVLDEQPLATEGWMS